MKQDLWKIPAAAILAAAAAAANAETIDAPAGDSALFRKLDADRDGFVTRAEARRAKGLEAVFAEADDNKDGRLSREEFVKAESLHNRGQAGLYLEDSMTTAKVKAALLKELPATATQVSVETYRGRVLVSGFVDDEQDVKRVREVAASVRGVTRVSSGLQVK